jgi:biopolymer transport protein ExbD
MRRFPQRRRRRSPKIEIIPMVDVMFLLLVFYVLSSLALTQHKGIPVQLPSAQSSESAAQPQMVTVTIDSRGDTFLNTEKVPLEELGKRVETLSQTRPGGIEALRKEGVILSSDQQSQVGLTVKAMDQLRQIGIYNFAISTKPEPRP